MARGGSKCAGFLLALALCSACARAEGTTGPLHFPRDFGSHPEFRTEWWYLTGWLDDGRNHFGFQVTFFRVRTDPALLAGNPSKFSPAQILIGHAALSDPGAAHLLQAQRVSRVGFGLAAAQEATTAVQIDDWSMARRAGGYRARITDTAFELTLELDVRDPPMLNGERGVSRKGPDAQSFSFYYSEPQLTVSGSVRSGARRAAVKGTAWLDHEWSNQYLDPRANGWDWTGINFNDGSALMAFRIRTASDKTFWAGGTFRGPAGEMRVLDRSEIDFTPLRRWRSQRTGTEYPISWRIRTPVKSVELEPLFDDQENDTRATTGAIYWEGAVRVLQDRREVGQGYLELTGYESRLRLP